MLTAAYTLGRSRMGEKMVIKLPQPKIIGKVSLEQTLSKRRSIRRYINKNFTQEQVSQLLWSAQGITEPRMRFRTAPSAGALYPMEIYLVAHNGLYHYIPDGHKIEKLSDRDIRREFSGACGGQRFIAEASISIVISAVYERVTGRYGKRGIRYVDMEAGHIAQNIHLQAVAMDLGSVSVGAFDDAAVEKLLNLPKDHRVIYIIPVGYSAK